MKACIPRVLTDAMAKEGRGYLNTLGSGLRNQGKHGLLKLLCRKLVIADRIERERERRHEVINRAYFAGKTHFFSWKGEQYIPDETELAVEFAALKKFDEARLQS